MRKTVLCCAIGLGLSTPAFAQLTRVTVGPGGAQCQAETPISSARLSADGRKVFLDTTCTTLTTTGEAGLLAWDRATRTFTKIADSVPRDSSGPITVVDPDTGERHELPQEGWHREVGRSDDGKHVAYFTGGLPGKYAYAPFLYVWDGTTNRICSAHVNDDGDPGNANFAFPQIPGSTQSEAVLSRNGRYVAYDSVSSNLVTGDGNRTTDIFVHDCGTRQTKRVSVTTTGAEANGGSVGPAISGDGRYVSFYTTATNLDTQGRGGVFIHDRVTATTRRVGFFTARSDFAFFWAILRRSCVSAMMAAAFYSPKEVEPTLHRPLRGSRTSKAGGSRQSSRRLFFHRQHLRFYRTCPCRA